VTTYEHLDRYAGLRVVDFRSDDKPKPGERVAWRVDIEWGSDPRLMASAFSQVFDRFLATVDTTAVTHLVFGYWGSGIETSSEGPLRMLVDAAPRLPALKAVFFGEIIQEEEEISWIQQCDITPLLRAYPGLERLDVRGGNGLELSPLSSTALKVLRFESGGLPAAVVRAVGASDLPNLQTLELWLGVREYGGDATVADLAGILSGERLPALTRLGLMDSEIQDQICGAVAAAPVVARLKELVLSMGVLTDDGAEALLSGQPLTHLIELDLRHHFLTDPMAARLRAALAPVKMLLMEHAPRDDEDDEEEGEFLRFVEVAE
jgi:hypothetical protein